MAKLAGGAIPADYDYINIYNSYRNPSTVHCKNTMLVWYYQRYYLDKLMSVFELEGAPDQWSRDGRDYLFYNLFIMGHAAIINHVKYGIIPQFCTLTGYNVFRGPARALIVNPLFRDSIDAQIDKQCAVIKLRPDYCGAWDLISYYADLKALAAEAVGYNLINSKLAYVFASPNKGSAESLKKLYDQIASGNPAAFIDKELLDENGQLTVQMFTQNLQQNYIAGDILEDMEMLDTAFNTAVGIPNVNIAKASGVSDSEVNANNTETRVLCELWLDELNRGADRANELFGTNLRFKLRFDRREAGVYGDNGAVDRRTV